MSPPDDAPSSLGLLLSRHKAGDPAAINDIIIHSQERLKQLTRQMLQRFPGVQQWEETSDVYHNVLIKLTAALRELTFETTIDFLRLAACHIRRELLDLAKKCRPILAGGPGGNSSSPGQVVDKPDIANDPYNLAQWEEVHSMIDQLEHDYRQLFDLLYYQDLTQPEAAELLEMPLRTLKRKWQIAREKLIDMLGDTPPF
ncbi:MAG TPA: sigma-70 family RNA polymerase sigma factor [Gemmata sp.]|jgi:RNA polymerase sigma-70 factor (ECF subfamily)|nr:sigma-70 family RNA polymerase sigma factor [Gemmata sp.]